MDQNFFGNLIINESELLKSTKEEPPKENVKEHLFVKAKRKDNHANLSKKPASNEDDKVHMFGTLRVRLKRLVEQVNEIIKNPTVEFDLSIMPKYITSFNNTIFICDEEANLLVGDLGATFNIKSTLKLNMVNVRGLAANKKYLAMSYSDLSNEKLNQLNKISKKFEKKNGIVLFKFNDSLTSASIDKLFESNNKNIHFMSPSGIALNDQFLFVCDRELHGVFKFDLKTGNLVQKILNTEQEPSGIALGEKYFVYTDSLKLELNLVDMETFNIVKCVKISDESFNEPFDVAYKENHYVFVKNRDDSKIIVYDSHLNFKYTFEYDYSNLQGITYLKSKHEFLLTGYFNSNEHAHIYNNNCNSPKSVFKLGLFSDF